MTTPRILVEHANHLPVGDPKSGQVALGPLIDAKQRDRVHSMVSDSVSAGATLAAGGTYEELFYRPTVLTHIPTTAPAYAEEVFGPVAPIVSFGSLDEAVALASATPYGLSLSIISGDGLRALELASRIPSGAIHINDADAGRRGDDPLRRRRRQWQRFANGWPGQPRRVHRDPVGHGAGRHRLLPVLGNYRLERFT